MPKIKLENPRINETVYIGGVAIRVTDGVAESEDENVLTQARAAGYQIEGDEDPSVKSKTELTEEEKAKLAAEKANGGEGGDANQTPTGGELPGTTPGVVTKEALVEVAKELGIEVNGRWGIPKLTEEIEKARVARNAQ